MKNYYILVHAGSIIQRFKTKTSATNARKKIPAKLRKETKVVKSPFYHR